MLRRRLLQLLATLPLATTFPVRASETQVLRLGIMPFNSTLALFKTHQPLRSYLQQRLARPVELFTAPDYFTFLNSLLAGEYDLAIAGPHFAVMALDKGYTPLTHYRAVLQPLAVVRNDSPIRALEDLRGKRIGLSSRLSISSIGGVKWLLDRGLQIGKDYQLYERTTHGAAVAAVAVGDLDAALTANTPLKQIPEDIRSQVRILPFNIQVPHLMTLANKRLGQSQIRQIQAILNEFGGTQEGKAFFAETGYEGYAPVTAQDIASLKPFVNLTKLLLAHNQ